MNKNIEITEEYMCGNVKDIREHIIEELILQKDDDSICDEMFIYNCGRLLEVLQKLEWLRDNTEVMIKESPMGNFELDIIKLGIEKDMEKERGNE